jgi:hypothetical protein
VKRGGFSFPAFLGPDLPLYLLYFALHFLERPAEFPDFFNLNSALLDFATAILLLFPTHHFTV